MFDLYLDVVLMVSGIGFCLLGLFFGLSVMQIKRKSRVMFDLLNQETATASQTFTLKQTNTYNPTPLLSTGTELLNDPEPLGETFALGIEQPQPQASNYSSGFNPDVINHKYTLLREIGGGAMSQTFVVKNKQLGNFWFLKFVSSKLGGLASEEEILKRLNHPNLPQIVDIYHQVEGTYIIQTLVEGSSLDKLELSQGVTHATLLDWFLQLARSLNYLHTLQPTIYHLDLKPGNIIVGQENHVTLIDFGISRMGEQSGVEAATLKYAAPEQMKKVSRSTQSAIEQRFGALPADYTYWPLDARTDIYTLGVIIFELATGQMATTSNVKLLANYLPLEVCAIVEKCMALRPEERYQTAVELISDLSTLEASKLKAAKQLVFFKFARVASVLCALSAIGSFAGAYHVFGIENGATLIQSPQMVSLSVGTSSPVHLERLFEDGRLQWIDSDRIQWSNWQDNIARIEHNIVSGLNIGHTQLQGQHRNGEVVLEVTVTEPMHGMVDIVQHYDARRYLSIFDERLFSPESIVSTDDGFFVTSAGRLYQMNPEQTPIRLPAFINVDQVRQFNNNPVIRSSPWQNSDGGFEIALASLTSTDELDFLYVADAGFVAIEDFDVDQDGRLFFIERNAGLGVVMLRSFELSTAEQIINHLVLEVGSSALALSPWGVFIANSQTGVIQLYSEGELHNFSGLSDEPRGFIDGAVPRFYSPQRILYHRNGLYVWDFNTLRRVQVLSDGIAGQATSLAGLASPSYTALLYPQRPAHEAILPHGALMDFTIYGEEIFITDHKTAVIWYLHD